MALLGLLVLIGLVVWLLPLAQAGHIPVGTAAVAIVAAVLLLSFAQAAARAAFQVGLPLAALAVVLIVYGRGDPWATTSLLISLAPLALILLAIQIMFRSLFGRTK